MAIVAGDFVRVTINGTDRTDFVVEYGRYSSLCELGQSFSLVLSHDYPVALGPYDDIVIREWYDGDLALVLRGFAITIDQDFDGNFKIQGQDKSVLLFDYFIPTQIKSQGESVDFWMDFYADQVGLTLEFQASSPFVDVAPGTLMGMQTAGDGILTMERLAAYFTKYDSTSDKLIAFRLGSSEPVITINDVTEGRRELGTEKTRNVVKVYGGYRFSLDLNDPPEQLYSEARSEIPELLVDKTVVVSSPGLQKQTFLDIVADRILNTVNSIDDVHMYSLPKFVPSIQVGQVAYIDVDHPPHISYTGERKITSIEASFNDNGAQTIIGIGEKCPRVSVQFPTPPVYATTTEDGVAVSWNAGNSFVPSNTGLTGSGLMGENIGVNSYGQQMVLTAAGIFKRPSTAFSWSFVDDVSTLPNPINDSNDLPSGTLATNLELVRIVDEPTNRNVFHFLANATTSGLGRTWVYTTKDFGSSWDSTQLYFVASGQDHPVAPSGLSYDVYGHDLFGGIDNSVYALVTSLADFFVEGLQTDKIYWAGSATSASNRSWVGLYDGTVLTESTSYDFTAGDLHSGSRIYSLPEDRNICFVVMTGVHNPSSEREHFVTLRLTKDGGLTWTTLIDNVSFYSGSFQGPAEGEPFDYATRIYIDYASTKTEFRAVVSGITHDAGSPLADASFRGFFINADAVAETETHSIVTELIEIRGFTGEGTATMSHRSSASFSTNLTGTNYAFDSLFGANALINEVPEIFANQYNLVVARYDMTAQTIVEAINIKHERDDDEFELTGKDGGVFSADGITPFCFINLRELVSEDPSFYEGTEFFYRGSSLIYTAGPSDPKWIPNGITFSNGTDGAIAFEAFGKTFYDDGSLVSNTSTTQPTAIKEHQGPASTQIWYINTNFTFWVHIDDCLDSTEYWDTSQGGFNATDFAWRDFIDL